MRLRREKTRGREILEVSVGFFVFDDQMQRFFDQNELQIKMPSGMSFTFIVAELRVALSSLSLIGLLLGNGCCMMTIMMVIIGMMKIYFLSSNEKLKKPQ